MKVRIAESAGFCMGVRNAMDMVLDASRGKSVTYTLGPLIHNPQAVRMLESRNVYVSECIDESLAGRTVVIRAHGIPLEKRELLDSFKADIVDATCPKVLRSERLLRKYRDDGYDIVIVGDRGHAEIDALMSYTGGRGTVIESVEEARALPRRDKVCVIAQTTFNREAYETIAAEVCERAGECVITKTVCRSTERRQADVRKLARETDATVVVGGRNSANTRRLAEISREKGQPTWHIEDPSELDFEELSRYDEIGITAGASTPNWVIKQVYDAIAGYTPETKRSPGSLLMSMAFFAIEGNFVICAGSVALIFAMSVFAGRAGPAFLVLMPFFYLFPLHAVNKYLEINWEQLAKSRQVEKFRRYWRFFLGIGFVFFLVTLALAWRFGGLTFALTVVSYLLGLLYSVRIVPDSWRMRFRSLRDIPGSKDVFIAVAWTFAVVVLPHIALGYFPGLQEMLIGMFVFVTVFSRTTLLAIGGIQSDKLIGQETIPVLIGRRKTVRLLHAANIALSASILGLALPDFVPRRYLLLLAPVGYMFFCIGFLSRKNRFFTLYHQMMIDAVFFITGLLGIAVLAWR